MPNTVHDKIRPLWLVFSNRWGASETLALSDISDLAADGLGVSLVCLEGSPVHAAATRMKGVEIFPLKTDRRLAHVLKGIVLQTGSNIVHLNNELALLDLERAVFRQTEVSIVANRHGFSEGSWRDIFRKLLMRRLDYLVVSSESVKQNVQTTLRIPEKKVKVINLGLDFTRFDPAKTSGHEVRKSWTADKDTIVVGSGGRLSGEVGQATFLKAAAGLMKDPERKMRFVIVGEEPLAAAQEYVEELRGLVKQFRMEEVVTICSLSDKGIENLPDIMSSFDIFVMAGNEEVPGLGALEALAMERPVVLSNVPGAGDIVGNREFGLTVRPEDAFDLQQKIMILLENPSQRLSMGTNGRKHVLKFFDKKIRFERLIDVYEKCMKRRFSLGGRAGRDKNRSLSV